MDTLWDVYYGLDLTQRVILVAVGGMVGLTLLIVLVRDLFGPKREPEKSGADKPSERKSETGLSKAPSFIPSTYEPTYNAKEEALKATGGRPGNVGSGNQLGTLTDGRAFFGPVILDLVTPDGGVYKREQLASLYAMKVRRGDLMDKWGEFKVYVSLERYDGPKILIEHNY